MTHSALVILAAGMSSRYGRPKQLEPIGPSGETLLDYCAFDARRAGFGSVVLLIRCELERAIRERAERWEGMPVRYAFQEPAAGRSKPWGTAHAVLAAAPETDGAFGVCNADDFYGAGAYRLLADHLRSGPAPDSAIVAYRMGETLSPHGGVSRAVCETDGQGFLTALTELRDVRRAGEVARGRDPEGRAREVPLDAATSLNLWGVSPELLPLLRQGFDRFAALHRADPDAEYPLSTAVDHLARGRGIRVRVLRTGEAWSGITHPADRQPVAERLRALAAERRYPTPLFPPGGREG